MRSRAALALLVIGALFIGGVLGYGVFSSVAPASEPEPVVGVVATDPTPSPTPAPTPSPTPSPQPVSRSSGRSSSGSSGGGSSSGRMCPANCECGTSPGGGSFIRCRTVIRSADETS